jgi:hypothetical protein
MKNTEWVAPIFIVVAILAIWLSVTYLPLVELGIDFPDSSSLWYYMPWLVALAVGLYALKTIYRRH